jgi:hypothetical protein
VRHLNRLALALVLFAGAFVIAGVFLPSAIRVQRATIIDAAPAQVFPFLNDFRKFNAWSPWAARDPAAQYDFTGPDRGPGATMSWRSDKLGEGRQQIIVSLPDERVVTRLDLGPMGTAEAAFTLTQQSPGTLVTWSFSTKLPANPLTRWLGLTFPRWIGADYEEGLARLKSLVERGAA